jgi:anti-anti-sigma factor
VTDSGVWDTVSGESSRRARFAVGSEAVADAVVLALSGDLDHDTADELGQALDSAAARTGRILVDCAELEFCDSSGLNMLLRARRAAKESGSELALIGRPGALGRLLEITGMGEVFTTYQSLDEAVGTDRSPAKPAEDS